MFRVWQPREASPRGLSGLHVREPPPHHSEVRGILLSELPALCKVEPVCLGLAPSQSPLRVPSVRVGERGQPLPGASPEPLLGLQVFSQEVGELGLYPPVEVPTGLWFPVPALAAHASHSNKHTQPKFLRDLIFLAGKRRAGVGCPCPRPGKQQGHRVSPRWVLWASLPAWSGVPGEEGLVLCTVSAPLRALRVCISIWRG